MPLQSNVLEKMMFLMSTWPAYLKLNFRHRRVHLNMFEKIWLCCFMVYSKNTTTAQIQLLLNAWVQTSAAHPDFAIHAKSDAEKKNSSTLAGIITAGESRDALTRCRNTESSSFTASNITHSIWMDSSWHSQLWDSAVTHRPRVAIRQDGLLGEGVGRDFETHQFNLWITSTNYVSD